MPQFVEITRFHAERLDHSLKVLLLLAAQHITGEEDHSLTASRLSLGVPMRWLSVQTVSRVPPHDDLSRTTLSGSLCTRWS